MMAKGKLDKICSLHYIPENNLDNDLMTADETKERIIQILEELTKLNNKILPIHNDVYLATYLNVTHWWYELWDDFLKYIVQSESFLIFQRSKLETIFNLVEHFMREANSAPFHLREWDKKFLFEKFAKD